MIVLLQTANPSHVELPTYDGSGLLSSHKILTVYLTTLAKCFSKDLQAKHIPGDHLGVDCRIQAWQTTYPAVLGSSQKHGGLAGV